MRITIDATSLLLPGAGIKSHWFYWIRSLQAAAPSRDFVVGTYPPFLSTATIDHQADYTRSVLEYAQMTIVRLAKIPKSPVLDCLLARSSLFHCSQHLKCIPSGPKTTATIFDLSCWTKPETHTRENIAATKRYAELILKRCDRLIANSAHVRSDASDILGIPLERMTVIHPGVAEPFFHVTPEDVVPVRAMYHLPARYLLFVGCIEPRKNIRGLIRAWQDLPESIRRDVPLVIAGPMGWESVDIQPLMRARGVRYLGYVPEVHMPALFRGAAAFVYPSFYEGFGLPVAQAMATGVPVITSNSSSLPEVVGECGSLVDPYSTADLSTAMYSVLTCPARAADFASRGRLRAEAFHWSATALASLDFFTQVLASG